MKFWTNWHIILLGLCFVLAIIAINPVGFLHSGVAIRNVDKGSAANLGAGSILIVNHSPITVAANITNSTGGDTTITARVRGDNASSSRETSIL